MSITLKKTRSGLDYMEISAHDWADLEEAVECRVSLGDVIKLYLGNGKGIVYARISRITAQEVACYSCGKKFEPRRQNSMTCSAECFEILRCTSSRKRAEVFRRAIKERKAALSAIQAEDDA